MVLFLSMQIDSLRKMGLPRRQPRPQQNPLQRQLEGVFYWPEARFSVSSSMNGSRMPTASASSKAAFVNSSASVTAWNIETAGWPERLRFADPQSGQLPTRSMQSSDSLNGVAG